MCGINGATAASLDTLKKMNDALSHRGPDASGVFHDEHVSLGHRRLAVVDLSEGGVQPMGYQKEFGASSEVFHPDSYKESKYVLVFNGEIYNYEEIRAHLQSTGYVFRTESDSEIILAAYDAWGEACVTHFNGMWAFAIYDKEKETLFISRDRLGVKPLYYSLGEGTFSFSSEIKGLLAAGVDTSLDSESVELYFSLGFIPAPHSIYRAIRKLPAAHTMRYDLAAHTCGISQYWEMPQYAPEYNRGKLIAEGKELLADATRIRMRADVPVGAFLSGGLDSSAIVGEMRKYTKAENLHTFSIGFDGIYDESRFIHLVADTMQTKHHHTYFTRDDFDTRVADFVHMYDEPLADTSGFPTRLLSEKTREHVTVALSGDGGDEVFGGYWSHIAGRRFDLLQRVPRFIRVILAHIPRSGIFARTPLHSLQVACRLSLGRPEDFLADMAFGDTFRTDNTREWLRERFAYALERGRGVYAEALRIHDAISNTLPDAFLVKVDRASMFHSLEVRSPFLDYRFFEYAQRIPSKWKVGLFRGKILMREIIKDCVPQEILHRGKQGFSPPINDWIVEEQYQEELKQAVADLESISPVVADWYRERLSVSTTVNRIYLVRLFVFRAWFKYWVLEKSKI